MDSILKIDISWNTNRKNLVGFPKSDPMKNFYYCLMDLTYYCANYDNKSALTLLRMHVIGEFILLHT